MSKINCVVCSGEVIHIGDWDYKIPNGIDSDGNEVFVDNPLPDKAEQGIFDVLQTSSGKYALSSDYYELRKEEYPSIGDQLDSLFWAGVFPQEMHDRIQEIKDKYPKSQ